MQVHIAPSPIEVGQQAGSAGAQLIREAILANGSASIILATGTSQFETLKHLLAEPGIDWRKVAAFHLDEYIGLEASHPASFRKYLVDRFFNQIPELTSYYLIDGEKNPQDECARLSQLIQKHPIDVAFIGIGENGHLAFNDPPADFDTREPFIEVELDHTSRMQQLNEGWFPDLESVPSRAISMSIAQLMKSKSIICSVPDHRKAQAVRDCLEGPVTNKHPASILQEHPDCRLFLDEAAASFISGH